MSFSGWREVKLGELLNFRRGHDLPKTKMLDGNIPVVGSNGVIGFHNEITTKAPCLTIGRSGNIGNPCYINKDCWAHNTSLYVDDFKGNDPKYLYYLLKTLNLGHYGGGSAVPTLNRNHIHPIETKATINTAEQKAIAHILSTLDDKIEVNNQINKTLENMAQAIFKQWFVDFEFPNEDGEPYKSSGGEMVETELGLIPKGWEVGNIAESKLTNLVKTGITEFSGEKIYLATADVDKSNILSNTTKVTYNERPSRANMQPKENTVWFAKMKDSRKLIRVSRGSKDLIENYIFSTGFAGINVKEGLNYIWSFICSNDFDIRKNNLCHGTTMQAINNSNISNIPLLLPNEEILKKYEDITDYLFESEYLRKKENEKLAEIRDTLLPKLMSGKIRVPLDSEGEAS